mmetsp:Transcript_6107/g.21644  ORF Transcript_6107/g.21644 Transcript_6107/m.21644 type:complete len:180 (-) Transcript_6107:131-670(-)
MPRARKLHFAVELSWGLAELRRADIVHCDVKPSNALLQEKRRGKSPGVILIDFGEANFSEQAKDWNAGTPGYQAPEVEEEGASFASDVYSLGVSLIELWTGDVWQGAETRGEGEPGMRREILDALKRVQAADPQVAKILRRCISKDPNKRPSARRLGSMFHRLQYKRKLERLMFPYKKP